MVSANTLFHFTNHIDHIEGILKNGFMPRLCLESMRFMKKGDESIDLSIPMCCFCDIPLSQIAEHTSKYGNYAIGLSKTWALKKRISPIFYVRRNAATNRIIDNIIANIRNTEDGFLPINNNNKHLFYLLSFMKDYSGKMWRWSQNGDYVLSGDIRFYDEREWRYVPQFGNDDNVLLSKNDFLTHRAEVNQRLMGYSIDFKPSDIKYIIVDNEADRLTIIKKIESYMEDKYTAIDLKMLMSRILSMQQVKEDF